MDCSHNIRYFGAAAAGSAAISTETGKKKKLKIKIAPTWDFLTQSLTEVF